MSGYEGTSRATRFILPFSGRWNLYHLTREPFWRVVDWQCGRVIRGEFYSLRVERLLLHLLRLPYWLDNAMVEFECVLYETLTQGEILRG